MPDAWVLFDGGVIAASGAGRATAPYAEESMDLVGARLVPGFLDLHGHGGGGHSYDDGGEERAAALHAHRMHGTTRSVIAVGIGARVRAGPPADRTLALTESALHRY